MIQHGGDVQKYAKMKAQAVGKEARGGELKNVTSLSQSLVAEVNRKVKERVVELSKEKGPKVKVSLAKKKQRTCVLCKRVFPRDQIRSQVVPAIFGMGEKERVVCVNCSLLSTFIADPSLAEDKEEK